MIWLQCSSVTSDIYTQSGLKHHMESKIALTNRTQMTNECKNTLLKMILILIVLPRDRRDPEGVVIGRENMNGMGNDSYRLMS